MFQQNDTLYKGSNCLIACIYIYIYIYRILHAITKSYNIAYLTRCSNVFQILQTNGNVRFLNHLVELFVAIVNLLFFLFIILYYIYMYVCIKTSIGNKRFIKRKMILTFFVKSIKCFSLSTFCCILHGNTLTPFCCKKKKKTTKNVNKFASVTTQHYTLVCKSFCFPPRWSGWLCFDFWQTRPFLSAPACKSARLLRRVFRLSPFSSSVWPTSPWRAFATLALPTTSAWPTRLLYNASSPTTVEHSSAPLRCDVATNTQRTSFVKCKCYDNQCIAFSLVSRVVWSSVQCGNTLGKLWSYRSPNRPISTWPTDVYNCLWSEVLSRINGTRESRTCKPNNVWKHNARTDENINCSGQHVFFTCL